MKSFKINFFIPYKADPFFKMDADDLRKGWCHGQLGLQLWLPRRDLEKKMQNRLAMCKQDAERVQKYGKEE